ncbi:hypothetical protein niasHT_027075 [Heterodera trifolii]|uniref:Uncharacterized protein n=1 Tax=Heterodera trifolii TaxID=157864 RepID=A0ABD2KU56_9BILA
MQLQFVALLARRLTISSDGTHLAVIQFAESAQLEITLNQYSCESQNGFQNARGGIVPKVAIVVTDGQSQDEVEESAKHLRDAQVMVYAIGVTNLVNIRQLHQITGDALRVHTVEAFDQLDKSLADSITWHMCSTEFHPGTPEIICEPDKIGVRASTKKQFDGIVFVQDNFDRAECRAGPEHFPDPKIIGITVPFRNCNVRRYRSLNPRGIFVEMAVVFMFHPVFMTKVDQMVKIQCFYMEAEKEVKVPMEVSQITTQFYQQVYQMPRCEYTLRKDHANGPVVQYAVLGQSVFHRLATKEYHVFKYADRPVLQFQCQITLCLKLDNGCAGITPPKCAATVPRHTVTEQYTTRKRKSKRQRKVRSVAQRQQNESGQIIGDEQNGGTRMDVFTRPIMVVENTQMLATLQNANTALKHTVAKPVHSTMSGADRLQLCRRYFHVGFACLPLIWAVNAIWFFRYAFPSGANATAETAQIRRYVCWSATGALCWGFLLTGWLFFYNIQRSYGLYDWPEKITAVFPLGYV